MTVYVDDVEHSFSRMKMCHMWADSLDELLAMADTIGVARKWIQGHPTLSFGKHRNASWVHFDIAKGKKALAIKAGAVLTDQYGSVEHVARLQGDLKKLETVRRVRRQAAHDLHPVDGLGGQQRYCPRCKLMGSTETFQTYDCINKGG